MIESLIGTIAVIALIIVVARQNSRIGLLEREIGALRSFVLANPAATDTSKAAAAPAEREAVADAGAPAIEMLAAEPSAADVVPQDGAAETGPWVAAASVSAEQTASAETPPAEMPLPAASPFQRKA